MAFYGRLGANPRDPQTPDSTVTIRTATVVQSDLAKTIRLSGIISAERFNGLLVPQLSGRRQGGGGPGGSGGGGGNSGGGGSSSGSSSSSGGSSSSSGSSGSASATATGGSNQGGSTNSAATAASATGAGSSLGALRGTTNRFGDRSQSQKSSSGSSSKKSSTTSSGGSSTSGLGSTASSLIGGQQRGMGGGGNDFNLVLLKLVPAGSHVKKGEIIAEFDRQNQLNRLDDYKASVIQLDANIKKLKANLAVVKEAHDQLIRSAKANLDKAELDLKTAPVRSQIEGETLKLSLEEAQARYKQLLAEVKLVEDSQRAQIRASEISRDQSKIELQRAERNVDKMVIRAPMDGVAVMQSIFRGGDMGQVQQGDQVNPGMQFMQVVDPSSMVITSVINQVDAESIRLGMKATVRIDAYPGLELPGHVVGIGAMTKPGVWRPNYMREIPVRLKLDQMDPRVIPDVSASADVQIAVEKQARVAPLGAIFYDSPGKPFVFLRGPSGWERREVQLGLANYVEVALHSEIEKDSVIALERPPNQKQ